MVLGTLGATGDPKVLTIADRIPFIMGGSRLYGKRCPEINRVFGNGIVVSAFPTHLSLALLGRH